MIKTWKIFGKYHITKKYKKTLDCEIHDYRLVSRKIFKDYFICKKCDNKHYINNQFMYDENLYKEMKENYTTLKTKAEAFDLIYSKVKTSCVENEPLFRNLIDLMDVVGLEDLLTNQLQYDTKSFVNDLNDFLKFYVNYFASFVANESDDE